MTLTKEVFQFSEEVIFDSSSGSVFAPAKTIPFTSRDFANASREIRTTDTNNETGFESFLDAARSTIRFRISHIIRQSEPSLLTGIRTFSHVLGFRF